MNQDETADRSTTPADKVAPDTVTLRAQPRPVTRLNRRTLTILTGGLAVAVLGATFWSLQPPQRRGSEQTELYNVERVSRSEQLDRLPTDYSKLPSALPRDVPELGPPLPGDLGPAIVNAQQPAVASYSVPGHDPADALREEAEAAAASSLFFQTGNQDQPTTSGAAPPSPAAPDVGNALAAFDPLAAGPAHSSAVTTVIFSIASASDVGAAKNGTDKPSTAKIPSGSRRIS